MFADPSTNRAFGSDAVFQYRSGEPFGLALWAVDESGNKVVAFSGQKAIVKLRAQSDTGDILKEMQVDMVQGEGDLSEERWFLAGLASPTAQGTMEVKAARNAGLAGANLAFNITPGEWLSEVHLSVGSQPVDALSYEMGAHQRLLDISVKALAHNKAVYTGDFTLSLRPGASRVQNMAGVAAGGRGIKVMHGVDIPVAPGVYDVNIVAQSLDGAPPVSCTLTVTRAVGSVSEVQLKGPSKLCTQAKKDLVLAVSASTVLGAQLAPECWQGNLTFLVSDPRLKISIENRATPAAAAETTASYSITLDDDGDIEDDIIVRIWACVGPSVEGGSDDAQEGGIDSNVIEDFKYIPRARIEKETAHAKRKRAEEEQLTEQLGKFDILAEDHRMAEAAVKETTEELTQELGRVSAVHLPGHYPIERASVMEALSALLQDKQRDVQNLLAQVHWSEPDLQVRRNAALDSYMRRRAQDEAYGGVPLVGILGELACARDDTMAAAVAALLDDDLQALVVDTEDEVETLRAFCVENNLGALKIIALRSAASAQVLEDRGECARRASKYEGSLAYDALRVRGADALAPALQQLWWYILQGAVIFNSQEQMIKYRQEFGRTAAFVAPLPDGKKGWRVDARLFTRCLDQTTAACQLSVPSAAEESQDYKEASSMLEQLTGAHAALERVARRVDEACADCAEKRQRMQSYKEENRVEDLQQALKGLRDSERGGGKKAKATGGDADVLDLTMDTSSDEDEGGSSTAVAVARPVVATAVAVPADGNSSKVFVNAVAFLRPDDDDGEGRPGPSKKNRH